MSHYPPIDENDELSRRRRRAVRTAAVVALVAVAIHIGFILLGVLRG